MRCSLDPASLAGHPWLHSPPSLTSHTPLVYHAEIFKQRLGVVLETDDEMQCLVSGCNFLLRAISHEAFTFESGTPTYVPANAGSGLFPYLLVNIGSGVSILKVDGPDSYQRVSGSSLGECPGGARSGARLQLGRCRVVAPWQAMPGLHRHIAASRAEPCCTLSLLGPSHSIHLAAPINRCSIDMIVGPRDVTGVPVPVCRWRHVLGPVPAADAREGL